MSDPRLVLNKIHLALKSWRASFAFALVAIGATNAVAAVPVAPTPANSASSSSSLDVIAAFFALANPPDAVEVMNGREIDLPTGIEFLKLNIGFAAPAKIRFVSLESCKGEFPDGVEVMFHPGTRRVFIEGGKRHLRVQVPDDRPISATSVVFGHQAPPCLKNIEFFATDGRKHRLRTPERIPASFEREPAAALFDLSFGRSMSLVPEHPLSVEFRADQQVDRLQVWTGDPLTPRLFAESEKLRKFSISVDLQSPRTIEIDAKATAQTVEMLPPLNGKKFTVKALAKGKLSELRFGVGTKAETRIFVPTSAESETGIVKAFDEATLAHILDHELTTRGDARPWHFRFRSDGSYFVYGYNEGETRRGQISGLGRFEIVESHDGKIKLHLIGTRLETGAIWDGWFCGPACGEQGTRTMTAIDETIVVERAAAGFYMIRNRTAGPKRALLFGDLKSKVSTLSE